MMTKKGFTLMELLVSIFITGMVMLALVAMWRTASNQTAQAQRQSVIKNENTIFLRRFYNDFVSASEVICPWAYGQSVGQYECSKGKYLAVKEAVIDPDKDKHTNLIRITEPICGSGSEWGTENNDIGICEARCIKPSYTMYIYEKGNVYRCHKTFLTGSDNVIPIKNLISDAQNYCTKEVRELVLPYVSSFSLLTMQQDSNSGYHTLFPELLIDYTVNREFGNGIPPVTFRFKRLFTKKRGV